MIKDTELRKLPAGFLSTVEDVLETDEDWKRVMSLIPKNLESIDSESYELKYNAEDIRLIENHANETKVKCAKVLFGEWGTSGRVRPTLRTLQTILVKAQIFKAADAIANMLGEPLPRRPLYGPGAPIDINITSILNSDSMSQQIYSTENNNCNDPTRQMKSSNLIKFPTTKIVQHSAEQKSESAMIIFSETAVDIPPSSSTHQHQSCLNPNLLVPPPCPNLVSVDNPYLPNFDILNPKTITTDSMPMGSTSYSETLQSHYHATQSSNSQLNSYQSSNWFKLIENDILEDVSLIQFSFRELEIITNNFGDLKGSGGFGAVFMGNHEGLGPLAVKKAHIDQYSQQSLVDITEMFNNEVKSLSLLRHINIVPILGFSIDGPAPCIVCEYVDGGSLRQKIDDNVLNENQRIDIMIGTAEGLKYIHNTVKPNPMPSDRKSYFSHRDVKSANILLTNDFLPKLCDFGLVRQIDTTHKTANIKGTPPYMAPEYLSGTITQKSDIYSYGIVLLELLTGLKAVVDKNNEFMNIKVYIEENCVNDDITLLLDNVVENWTKAQSIYGIAKLCLKMEKNERPSMDIICEELYCIKNNNRG